MQSEHATTSPWEAAAPAIAAAVALSLAAAFTVGSDDFPLDDAWIHLSYAKSLRLGDGLSYNPGDWETGFSSPLWVAALSVWPTSGNPVVPVKLLGALLHALTAWLSTRLCLQLGRAQATVDAPLPLLSLSLLGGVLVAATPVLVQGSTSGMEVSLAAVTWVAAASAAIDGRPKAAAFLGLLSVWARPEAVLFFGAFGPALFWWRRRAKASLASIRAPIWTTFGAAAGLGLWVVYCLARTGHPWPNTQYIKGGGGGLGGLSYVADQVLPWQPWLVSLGGAVLIVLALRQQAKNRRGELWALVGAAIASWVAVAVSRPLHPEIGFYESRYFAPMAWVFAIAIPWGLPGLRRVWAAVAVVPLAAVVGLQLSAIHDETRALEDDTARLHTAAAHFVRDNLPADAVVAVEGAGAHRFFAPRTMTIVDIVGLNDHVAAHLHDDRQAKICHFVRLRPTHLVIPAPWVPQFAPAFALRPVARFDDPLYTQATPAYPLTVVVGAVVEIRAPWDTACSA